MRSYSGFLILEDLLDNLPSSNPNLVNFCYDVTNSFVTVIEEDCQTPVGEWITLDFSYLGYTELSTGLPLTQARITTILSMGVYNIAIRSLDTCISTGGVCQTCHKGSFIDHAIPSVGSVIRITPDYNYQTDVILSDGVTGTFTLTENADNYDKIIVVIDGVVISSGYTVTGSEIVFSPVPTLGTYIACRFNKTTNQPFLGYISSKYTGALLGMSTLPTQSLFLKHSLIQKNITATALAQAEAELIQYFPMITSNYIRYLDTIKDPLEKALYISVLYGIYGNVTV